jgi:hypothetical protein
VAAAGALWGNWSLPANWSLDPGRFPVAACEKIAARAPGIRLYNDVQFGGYLIWRLFPERKVFIDGRNELYAGLLPRLARIHAGQSPYEDWRKLITDYAIEGAIVRYKDTKVGVLYPAARPGDPPLRGYRAWSAFLFPRQEWALVDFDDTALVFMKRGGRGEPWANTDEYRDYNPEDDDYLLEKARLDPSFAKRLRSEVVRRQQQSPPCDRAKRFLEQLDELTVPVT